MISSKEQIINYFKSGIKSSEQFKIGIEHEKFLFDLDTNKRVDYQTILKMFKGLYEFGWKPIFEKRNETYPQLTDHYFTGDYPVKPIDELSDDKITQLSLLSTASNN